MSDKFDEVSDLLNQVNGEMSESEAMGADKNFNDSELEDIMSEIENLEKEFEAAEAEIEIKEIAVAQTTSIDTEMEIDPVFKAEAELALAVLADAPVKNLDLQNAIEGELKMNFDTTDVTEIVAEAKSEVEAEPAMVEEMPAAKVISFEKKPVAPVTSYTASPASSSEITFEAHGQMNLNLGFKIGEESARLVIDPVKGLVVTMSGVELCINQEEGCKVTMESGVKFSIPLSNSEAGSKKKSA